MRIEAMGTSVAHHLKPQTIFSHRAHRGMVTAPIPAPGAEGSSASSI